MRISDWSSDVCSSDLAQGGHHDICCHLDSHSTEALCSETVCEGAFARRRLLRRLPLACSPLARLGLCAARLDAAHRLLARSEEHTSELQSLMRISYAVFCLKKKNQQYIHHKPNSTQLSTTHNKT